MKITRNEIVAVAKKPYKLVGEETVDDIDYQSWIDFIESHKNLFVWYEETTEGKDILYNIDKVPEWAKERVLYTLSKKRALASEELMKTPTDLVISYSESDKRISVSLEKNLNKKTGKLILEMAKHLDALMLVDGKKIIDEKMIDSLPQLV
ncbi:hypothetical protein [Nubsella zeaxanthinifaciens]|uniref:hypothetical protein n=1 Tax=Nubsella zeaxanthinifaciens TaxID=392412 RepID=UPI000DE2EC6C|nr:hypothetical protein [Nubsella zeaxanthinifaciens]